MRQHPRAHFEKLAMPNPFHTLPRDVLRRMLVKTNLGLDDLSSLSVAMSNSRTRVSAADVMPKWHDAQTSGNVELIRGDVNANSHADNGDGSDLHPITFVHLSDMDWLEAPHFTLQGDWIYAVVMWCGGQINSKKLKQYATACLNCSGLSAITEAGRIIFGEAAPTIGNIHFRKQGEDRSHFRSPQTEKAEKPIVSAKKQAEIDVQKKLERQKAMQQLAELKKKGGSVSAADKNALAELKKNAGIKNLAPSTKDWKNKDASASRVTLEVALETLHGSFRKLGRGNYGRLLQAIQAKDDAYLVQLKANSSLPDGWQRTYFLGQDDAANWERLKRALRQLSTPSIFPTTSAAAAE